MLIYKEKSTGLYCIHNPYIAVKINLANSILYGLQHLKNGFINYEKLLNQGYKKLGLLLKHFNNNYICDSQYQIILAKCKQDFLIDIFNDYKNFCIKNYPNFIREF